MIQSLWLGSAIFLLLAANAAFTAAGDPTTAANVVGAMLTRWHYIAIGAPLVLFAIALRRGRTRTSVLLVVALFFAAAEALLDVEIRAMRARSPIAISALSSRDPARVRFGTLHGASSLLLLLQAVCAATVVVAEKET